MSVKKECQLCSHNFDRRVGLDNLHRMLVVQSSSYVDLRASPCLKTRKAFLLPCTMEGVAPDSC